MAYILATQSEVHRTAAAAAPRSLLEMQNSGPSSNLCIWIHILTSFPADVYVP